MPERAAPDRLLVTAGAVWDGSASELIEAGFVLVDGERIEAVGRQAELGVELVGEHGPRRVDLPGATIIPGLIDAHVHMALSGSRAPRADYATESGAGVAALTIRAVRNLRSAVEVGVTTVRDLGVSNDVGFAVRSAAADGRLVGPRVVTSGAPITVTGGHCHWFGLTCDCASEVRVAVRRQVRDGADWIKLMLSGGNLTPRSNPFAPQFGQGEVRACVEEADRLGVPVAVHAYDPASIAMAGSAGVATIEHCLFETSDGIRFDPAAAELMAANNVAFVPTISGAFRRLRSAEPGEPPLVARRYAARQSAIRGVFRALLASGVPVLAGSDAGVPQRPFAGFPADLAALVGDDGIGLTPREALMAATSGAAGRLGLDGGRLAPGARADLLAIDGDPLREIGALTRPLLVVAAGRPIAEGAAVRGGTTRVDGAQQVGAPVRSKA